MTRRSRWVRPFAAMFALWFAVMVGDPGMLHSCPMHGGHGAAGVGAAAGTHATHAMHATHAAHDADGSSAATHDGTSQHHGGTGPCTCVGQCCAASIVAPLPHVAATHLPATVARMEPLPLRAAGDAPASPDLRLPFANGPPVA